MNTSALIRNDWPSSFQDITRRSLAEEKRKKEKMTNNKNNNNKQQKHEFRQIRYVGPHYVGQAP